MCKEHRPIRNFISHHQHHRSHPAVNASHDQPQKHGLEIAYDNHGNFSITLHNVTLSDSGLYCCLVIEVKHHHPERRLYGYMELQVQTGELFCTDSHGWESGQVGVCVGGASANLPHDYVVLCKFCAWVWACDDLVCISLFVTE